MQRGRRTRRFKAAEDLRQNRRPPGDKPTWAREVPKGWPWGEGQILGQFDPMRFSRDYLEKSLEEW